MKTENRNSTQRNPDGITTEQVKLLSADFSDIATIHCEVARELVAMGNGYVLTDDAIVLCEE